MRVHRRRGSIRVGLDAIESDVLGRHLDDLEAALQDVDLSDPVHRRLFPDPVRDDARAAAELRALTQDGLREARLERLAQCRAEIPPAGGEFPLDPDGAGRWLAVLNDLRLQLGTQLDVREDDDVRLDPSAPDADRRLVYYWLTEFQDNLVRAAMR